MPIIKKRNMDKKDHPDMPKAGKSLSIALGVARQNQKKPIDMSNQVSKNDDVNEHYASIADAILAKKKQKMSDGGMVEPDNMEDPANPNAFDDQNMEAGEKELYDEDMSLQPMDSNEHGDDDLESDAHDMVSKIRKKFKK